MWRQYRFENNSRMVENMSACFPAMIRRLRGCDGMKFEESKGKDGDVVWSCGMEMVEHERYEAR